MHINDAFTFSIQECSCKYKFSEVCTGNIKYRLTFWLVFFCPEAVNLSRECGETVVDNRLTSIAIRTVCCLTAERAAVNECFYIFISFKFIVEFSRLECIVLSIVLCDVKNVSSTLRFNRKNIRQNRLSFLSMWNFCLLFFKKTSRTICTKIISAYFIKYTISMQGIKTDQKISTSMFKDFPRFYFPLDHMFLVIMQFRPHSFRNL